MLVKTISIFRLSNGNIFHHDIKIGEYMDIICPQYDVDEINIMTFVIYNVTKQVFENCDKVNEGYSFNNSCD